MHVSASACTWCAAHSFIVCCYDNTTSSLLKSGSQSCLIILERQFCPSFCLSHSAHAHCGLQLYERLERTKHVSSQIDCCCTVIAAEWLKLPTIYMRSAGRRSFVRLSLQDCLSVAGKSTSSDSARRLSTKWRQFRPISPTSVIFSAHYSVSLDFSISFCCCCCLAVRSLADVWFFRRVENIQHHSFTQRTVVDDDRHAEYCNYA